jgi:hypothetical protein
MFVRSSFVVASGLISGHIRAYDVNETCPYRSWSVRLHLHTRIRPGSGTSEDFVLRGEPDTPSKLLSGAIISRYGWRLACALFALDVPASNKTHDRPPGRKFDSTHSSTHSRSSGLLEPRNAPTRQCKLLQRFIFDARLSSLIELFETTMRILEVGPFD